MFSDEMIEEIKGHLENAQNPVFFYDNDCDGLCSFLILRRSLGRGKGVAVRSFPDLNAQYARKAKELNADYVFILDKPVVSKEFIEEVQNIGLPIIWIDHHDVKNEFDACEFDNLFIFNSAKEGDLSGEPVTYLTYKISGRKTELWLAVIGCISDHYMPEFSEEFAEAYPDLWASVKDPFDVYFGTELGRIAQALNFGLKDSTSNIVKLQNFLILCNSPTEVLSELPSNYFFRKKYQEIKKKYEVLLDNAKKCLKNKVLFFEYGGDLSISSEISNELSYLYPTKYIIVAYKKGIVSNISLRGKGVKGILEEILKYFEDGRGGGHENAVGARIKTEDLEKFRDLMEVIINERSKN